MFYDKKKNVFLNILLFSRPRCFRRDRAPREYEIPWRGFGRKRARVCACSYSDRTPRSTQRLELGGEHVAAIFDPGMSQFTFADVDIGRMSSGRRVKRNQTDAKRGGRFQRQTVHFCRIVGRTTIDRLGEHGLVCDVSNGWLRCHVKSSSTAITDF